ncbi:MAG: peptidylprolyl isomerase [Phenylobacterium sp.]|uniref:peptidylprolyl isomerase n=1 Tax=Phenylobacterium sp. TaxID=1871053 RepID=UPI00271FDA3D|nr:peptidylprolyl isomerase [Phenylobacterium sp.]MDO8900876.1 peptidylprolyl isomerase [Phenylobacterium sp.]MDP2213686.1 peptidylprolyl isomerase [Phenylobacterium sp.]
MLSARSVRGRAACGVALAALLATGALSGVAFAQDEAPARPAPAAGMSEYAAAVVNDEIISTYDLAQRMRLLIATTGVQPTEQNLPQIQQEALVSLVDEALQLQELRRVERQQKFSIIASDEDVDAEIAELAAGNEMTAEQFTSMLRSQGVLGSLREQLRAQASWQRWIQGRYGSRLRIGDDQVQAVLQQQRAQATRPQFQVSEVFIDSARVGGMDTALRGAEQLVSQMQQGAPFQAVARQFSAAPTAAAGGDAGWIGPGEMPAEVEQALDQMRPGQLSRPIPVSDGVYIVYLRDKRSGAGATVVSLKQAAIGVPASAPESQVSAARSRLMSLRSQITGCDDLEAVASREAGVIAGDLGEAEIGDLAPAFRTAAESLQIGELSEPIRTEAGMHIVAVCGKRASGGAELSPQMVERRLFFEQLGLIARRYMRDLRNAATLETR